MQKVLQGKIITVVGASGYVGATVCRQALLYGATVNAISRKGYPAGAHQEWYKDINWVRADAMQAHTFADVLKSSDLVVHSVGVLIDASVIGRKQPGEAGTYEQMNRDTLINVAKQIDPTTDKPTIVYISASRSPPFLERYLTTKQEAEQYLKDGGYKSVIMKAGFIYSWQQRWWSVPLKINLDLFRTLYSAADSFIPKQSMLGEVWSKLEVDSAVKLTDLVDASLYAAIEPNLVGRSLSNEEIADAASQLRQRFLIKS